MNRFFKKYLKKLIKKKAAKFCADLRKQEGHQAWIVGIVENGTRDAKVIDRPRIIEVITGEDGSVQVQYSHAMLLRNNH